MKVAQRMGWWLISLFMYALDGTSAGVIHILEGGVPFQCDGGGACY